MKIASACLWTLIPLLPLAATAQNENVFQFTFHGTGRFLNDAGRIQSRRVTTDDLIARCVGEEGLRTNNRGTNRVFELVYNPASEIIQVVNLTNGASLCDVFQFQGGSSNADQRQISRLAFVFIPEQTEAVGSAVITERIRNRADRRSLQGLLQFALPSLELGSSAGAEFASGSTDTNALSGDTNSISVPGAPLTPSPIITPGPSNTNSPGITAPTNVVTTPSTNLPITAPVIPTPITTPSTNANIIVTTNLSGAGNTGTTNSVSLLPPLPPGLPGATGSTNSSPAVTNTPSLVATNASNSVVVIGSQATTAITPPVTSVDTNTLVLPGVNLSPTNSTTTILGEASTNQLGELTITNGVIISGSFSVGRRIVLNSGSP